MNECLAKGLKFLFVHISTSKVQLFIQIKSSIVVFEFFCEIIHSYDFTKYHGFTKFLQNLVKIDFTEKC